MTEIFVAKTVEMAKEYASAKFNTDIKNIKFEVLEEPKKGILGIGAKDAKVKATYTPAPAKKAEEKPVADESKPKPVDLFKDDRYMKSAEPAVKAEAVEEVKAEPVEIKAETEEVKAESVEVKAEAEEIKAESVEVKAETDEVKAESVEVKAETGEIKAESVEVKAETEEVKAEPAEVKVEPVEEKSVKAERTARPEKRPYNKDKRNDRHGKKNSWKKDKPTEKAVVHEDDEADYAIENFTLIEDESLINPKVKLATDYIKSILRAMDVDVEFEIYQNETGSIVNLVSANNGTIIGRRGETLDALQYLCSIIANKGDKDYYRITIDCLGYRKKRKETLEQLAVKVAKSVLKTGRSQPLEPMNPYERRVIHSAVSGIEGVSSRSVGEEPYRKIIISSNSPRNSKRNGNNGKRPRNRDNTNFERRSVDLSTSFEKDYKRPKPEDEISGGLYGKIEL